MEWQKSSHYVVYAVAFCSSPISRCVVSELFSGYCIYLIDWASWFVYVYDIAPVTNWMCYYIVCYVVFSIYVRYINLYIFFYSQNFWPFLY
jgi:hypothetical protein